MASAEVCVNGEVAKDHLIGPGMCSVINYQFWVFESWNSLFLYQ